MLIRILIISAMVVVVFGMTTLFNVPPAITENGPTATQHNRIVEMAESWSGEVTYGVTYAALTPLSADSAIAADALFNPTDEYWGLPRSDGVDLVAGYCVACHSLAIVMQQHQTADGWTYLLDWMEEKQGMAPLAGDDRAAILSYLTREFGER